jgi:glycosyltransferase involved in cell wall biosynthesis
VRNQDRPMGVDGESLPLISVGLPTFNRAGSLRRAIESVLAQDYGNLELVVSDNASSDSTQGICREYSALDSRVRYIRQPSNRGASANFQTALTESRGQYFMWLSDDDWLDPQYLSQCVRVLMDRPEIVLACGAAKYIGREGSASLGAVVNLEHDSPAERVLNFYRQVNDNGTFYGLTRREVLLQNPMPDILGGDWILIGTLALLGKIQTLREVHIHRSSDGAGADVRALASRYGFSERAARQPHRTIALSVAKDIGLKSANFARLGIPNRWILAVRCGLVVRKRFVQFDFPLSSWPSRIRARAKRAMRTN